MWLTARPSHWGLPILTVALTLLLGGHPVAAESGQPMLFASGGGQLTAFGISTGQVAAVATGTSRIAISPDGRTMASAGEAETAPGAGIRYLRSGGAATVLASGDSRWSWIPPSWASNSGEFAFQLGFPGGAGGDSPGLYVADVVEDRIIDVSGFDRGRRDDVPVTGFDFSPNGRQVVAATFSDNGAFSLYDLDTRQRSEIAVDTPQPARVEIGALAWSPDGDTVAFWQGGVLGRSLRTVNMDSGVVTVLHEVPLGDHQSNRSTRLAWSPNGNAIAYTFSRGSNQWGVAVVDRSGQRSEIYTTSDRGADWGPLVWVSNSSLAFAVGRDVFELSLDGGAQVLFRAAEPVLSLAYSPNADPAWLPLVAQPRAIDTACPASEVPSAVFTDVGPTNAHIQAINCVAWAGVASGTSEVHYSPSSGVTRAQMATFIARTITTSGGQLPTSPPSAFRDVESGTHKQAIDQLAAVGVVSGTGDGAYSPGRLVTRAQMAAFIANAYEHRVGSPLRDARGDYFLDDNGNIHEDQINRVAEAGISGGTGDQQYSPQATVRRDQMASFIIRLIDLLSEVSGAAG